MTWNRRENQVQLQVLDSIIPEISDSDLRGDFNVSNVQKLDLLVTQITALFNFYSDVKNAESMLPNLSLLRVLLTLATRIPTINWIDDNGKNDIISSGNEREVSGDYTSMVPLRNRAMSWFQIYFSIIKKYDKDHKGPNPLYDHLRLLMEEFIVLPDYVGIIRNERAASKNARKDINTMFKPPTGILQMLEKSPKRKVVQKLPISPSVVNNSEDEAPLLMQPKILEEEIESVSHNYLPSKKRKTNTDPKSLDASLDILSGTSNSRKNSPSPAIEGEKVDTTNSKLFDDCLLSWKLNPTLNKGYSLWSLIEWAFYCAESSSDDLFLPVDYHSNLYKNYREFIGFFFEFLIFDLNLYMKTKLCTMFQCSNSQLRYEIYQAKPDPNNSNARLYQKELESHNTLISKLLLQRSHKPIYWYDRIVETSFYGLSLSEGSPRPLHCYSKENALTLNQIKKRNNKLPKKMNDNMIDSMLLRFQILYLVYYFSLLYSDQCPVDPEPRGAGPFINDSPLGTYNLIKLISNKLCSLDIRIIEKFIRVCTITSLETYRRKYRSQFFLLLMTEIIEQNTEIKLMSNIIGILRDMTLGSDWSLLYTYLAEKLSLKDNYEYFKISDEETDEKVYKLMKSWCITRSVIYLFLYFGCNICKKAIETHRLDSSTVTKKSSLEMIQSHIKEYDDQFIQYLRANDTKYKDDPVYRALQTGINVKNLEES